MVSKKEKIVTIAIDGRDWTDIMDQFNLYKSLKKQWSELGNKKKANWFDKRICEIHSREILPIIGR